MRISKGWLLLLVLLISGASATCPSPTTDFQIQYFTDTQNSLHFKEVRSPLQEWNSNLQNNESGFGPHTIWLKKRLCNPTNKNLHLAVEVPNHYLDTLDVFSQDEVGKWQKQELGSHQRFPYKWPTPLTFLHLKPLEAKEIYYRVRTESLHNFPFRVVEEETFSSQMHHQGIIYGIFVGLVLFSILLGILYSLSFSSRDFAYYSLYSFTTLLSCLYLNGYLFVFLPVYLGSLDNRAFNVLALIQLYFTLHFFRLFLFPQLPQKWIRSFDRGILLFFGTLIALTLTFILPYSSVFYLLRLLYPLVLILVFIISLIHFVKKHDPELFFFFFAQLALFAGILVAVIQSFQLVPSSGWELYSTEIFYGLNTLAMGAAFTLRFRRERREEHHKTLLAERHSAEQSKLREQDMRHHLNRTQHFAHVISHNLRSPVASILGLVDLIHHTGPRPELIEKTESIARSMDAKLHELNEILKIESTDLPKTEVNFVKILEEVAVENNPALKWKRLKLTWELEEKSTVWGVQSLLHSVFQNLLENAIKYSPREGTEIKIKSYRQNYTVAIEFIDQGTGIDLERYQHRLFKLYERLHPDIEGTGKGLYLCQVHLEQMNGKIEVDSKLGEGSTFRVWLNLFNPEVH